MLGKTDKSRGWFWVVFGFMVLVFGAWQSWSLRVKLWSDSSVVNTKVLAWGLVVSGFLWIVNGVNTIKKVGRA